MDSGAMQGVSGTDVIWWCLPNTRSTIFPASVLRHICPTAVIAALVTREQLDPMALGYCRYCGGNLPGGETRGQ